MAYTWRAAGCWGLGAVLWMGAVGCGAADDGTGETVDDAKAKWKAPAKGSCEFKAMLEVANEATLQELDVDAELNKKAAQNIIKARPFETIEEIDAVASVGPSALASILAYASDENGCGGGSGEVGILSDLDATVIPKSDPDLAAAPYPGVATLYQILEHKKNGEAGDMYFVTAREPAAVADVPEYLEEHGVPLGPIETGTSGIPSIAKKEKVKDARKILDGSGDQKFVLFGDSNHVDPEVYQEVRALYPDRVIGGFIHKVKNIDPARVEGLHLHEGYAEAAAILYGLEVLTRNEALTVMEAAKEEGFDITESEMEDLLDEHAP